MDFRWTCVALVPGMTEASCNYGRVALQAKLSSVTLFKFTFLRGVFVCACADGLPRQDCLDGLGVSYWVSIDRTCYIGFIRVS